MPFSLSEAAIVAIGVALFLLAYLASLWLAIKAPKGLLRTVGLILMGIAPFATALLLAYTAFGSLG